jgi:lipopolysaccharide/colanic/teichoic acid biosynthesis glycosyltransferase
MPARRGRATRNTPVNAKGQMSMVDPRPLTVHDVRRMRWDRAQYDRRWSVYPGITGLSQLLCCRGQRWSWFLDRVYIRRRTSWLELKIICLSFLATVFGKKKIKKLLRRA